MKKLLSMLMVMALLLPGMALGSESFDGVVIAGDAVLVTAPYGGTVENVYVKQGQRLEVGVEILSLKTNRVIATEDGTIRGVFAKAGDDASGTVMYLAPVSKYTVRASISKANSAAETKYVTIGEKVYLRCSKDGTHVARGVITAVDGSSYTVQTSAGELYMEETVYIYRTADYSDDSCIGSGTVSRTDAVALRGNGSILRMHVADGEEVERGQLLFETVDGIIDQSVIDNASVCAEKSGVVAEVKARAGQKVSQGDVIMTLYQPGDYQIKFSIPEDMLTQVKAGDSAKLYFNWNEDKTEPCDGSVTEVSYIGTTAQGGGETTYDGYISFTADETVRVGMNVTVVLE